MITHERVINLLAYDEETGEFRWRHRRAGVRFNKPAGSIMRNGYLRATVDGKTYLLHRLAWFYVHGEWPENDIDHINNIPTDNRICNLRKATEIENGCNKRIASNNTSGVKGVTWNKSCKKWQVMISVNKKAIYLGVFSDINRAKEAIEKFRSSAHGKFCNHG